MHKSKTITEKFSEFDDPYVDDNIFGISNTTTSENNSQNKQCTERNDWDDLYCLLEENGLIDDHISDDSGSGSDSNNTTTLDPDSALKLGFFYEVKYEETFTNEVKFEPQTYYYDDLPDNLLKYYQYIADTNNNEKNASLNNSNIITSEDLVTLYLTKPEVIDWTMHEYHF